MRKTASKARRIVPVPRVADPRQLYNTYTYVCCMQTARLPAGTFSLTNHAPCPMRRRGGLRKLDSAWVIAV